MLQSWWKPSNKLRAWWRIGRDSLDQIVLCRSQLTITDFSLRLFLLIILLLRIWCPGFDVLMKFLMSFILFLRMWLDGLEFGCKHIGFYCGGGIQQCDVILTRKNTCSITCSFGRQQTQTLSLLSLGVGGAVSITSKFLWFQNGVSCNGKCSHTFGAGSIHGYPKVTPYYPMLSKAIQVLENVGSKNIFWAR